MKYCVIVDGCSTGRYFVKYLNQAGYRCIHIQSHPNTFEIEKGVVDPKDYDLLLTFRGNIDEILSKLSEYSPAFIIPASEPAVELANELASILNLLPNAPNTGKICRNKHLTQQTLQKNGLRSIDELLTNNLASALQWAQNRWPVVIKPNDSGGADGFFICKNESEIRSAFDQVYGKISIFEKINDALLIQQYLQGPEYVVNTVSYKGEHFVESLMKYTRRVLPTGSIAYETTSLIEMAELPDSENFLNYVFKALTALGIRYGSTHNELIFTKDGPVMLECNARIMGDTLPLQILSDCLGHNLVELTVLSYTNPQKFLEYVRTPYHLKNHFMQAYLIADREGYIKSIALDKLKKLESLVQTRLYISEGDFLKKTKDLLTTPGCLFLSHAKKSIIEKDHQLFREIEKGLFTFSD